jgi:hypothetical protein
MRLLKWLFGETSEPNSLEARVGNPVDKEVEARKRQARDKDIRRKVIDVVLGLGTVEPHSKYPVREYSCGNYRDDKIDLRYSYGITKDSCSGSSPRGIDEYGEGYDYPNRITEHFEINIRFNHVVCYSEQGSYKKAGKYYYDTHFSPDYSLYSFPSDITIYTPGEWEAHLDELYHKVPQAKEDRLKREQEEKLKKEREERERKAQEELERKRKDIEYKKKNFGLE